METFSSDMVSYLRVQKYNFIFVPHFILIETREGKAKHFFI